MGRPSRPTLAPLTASVCAVILAAGCSNSSTAATAGAPSPGPASPSAPGRPFPGSAAPTRTSLPGAPTVAPVELDVGAVAARYLAARENAISYRHLSARDWLSEVQPVMTPTGWQRLSTSLGDDGGFPAATARQREWAVLATVACRHNPDAGVATSTQATLICAVTDRTIDASGGPVAAKDLPGIWPYDGAQPPALLSMRKVDGQWLVDTDETGQAG
jgi:hypothetical protein